MLLAGMLFHNTNKSLLSNVINLYVVSYKNLQYPASVTEEILLLIVILSTSVFIPYSSLM